MNIITLTLSPAYDLHCKAEKLDVNHENFATVLRRDAGGKGINISRALTENGYENTAVVVVGEENSADFCRQLKEEKITPIVFSRPGRIRENLTLHTADGRETRISFSGFAADEILLSQIEDAIADKLTAGSILTLTGSLPEGLKMQDVHAFLHHMRHRGVKLVIDSRSFGYDDLIKIKPFLIKPNEEEIEHYAGRPIKTITDTVETAKKLQSNGIENVMVTLGARGAILVTSDGTLFAQAPKLTAKSTIGAGDSAIAGFLTGVTDGASNEESLIRAVAFGCAACMQEGTRPPESTDVGVLLKKIRVL